jgi:Cys-rich radical ribosomally synthesized peptide
MIQYNKNAYEAMLGNITEKTIKASASCIGQCTGCMCNCQCTCSGGKISDYEWEGM